MVVVVVNDTVPENGIVNVDVPDVDGVVTDVVHVCVPMIVSAHGAGGAGATFGGSPRNEAPSAAPLAAMPAAAPATMPRKSRLRSSSIVSRGEFFFFFLLIDGTP